MIGTSMLAMPWAIQQSGFTLGILCMVFMGIITLYTCTLVLRHGNGGFGKIKQIKTKDSRERERERER